MQIAMTLGELLRESCSRVASSGKAFLALGKRPFVDLYCEPLLAHQAPEKRMVYQWPAKVAKLDQCKLAKVKLSSIAAE